MFRMQSAINRCIAYTQLADGRWHAEFHTLTDTSVEDDTLEGCRFKIITKIDEALANYFMEAKARRPSSELA